MRSAFGLQAFPLDQALDEPKTQLVDVAIAATQRPADDGGIDSGALKRIAGHAERVDFGSLRNLDVSIWSISPQGDVILRRGFRIVIVKQFIEMYEAFIPALFFPSLP